MFSGQRLSLVACAVAISISYGCSDAPTNPGIVVSALIPESPTSITAIAGETLRPTVLVRDQDGLPVENFRVAFRIISPGGELTAAEVATDTNGRASVGWKLAPKVGVNTVAAAHGILKVEFTAVGVAGPAAKIGKLSGDNQFALAGTPVLSPPEVLVTDANDNPVAKAEVSFSVLSGGGSVENGIVLTDDAGIARPGAWRVGVEESQSISATVSGLPSVIFSAIVTNDPCRGAAPLSIGETLSLVLPADSCPLADGRPSNRLGFYVTGTEPYILKQTAADFDSDLMLTTLSGVPVAEAAAGQPGLTASIQAILAPGAYLMTATSSKPGASGAYTIASSKGTNPKCDVFVTRGIKINRNIALDDCPVVTPYWSVEDRYTIYLEAGRTVTITLATTMFDNSLEIYGQTGGRMAWAEENLSNSSLDTQLPFKAPKSGYYIIHAISTYGNGPYTLTIE